MADSRKRTLPEAPPDQRSPTTFREADGYVRPGTQAVDGGLSKTNTFAELAQGLKSWKEAAAPLAEAERDKVLVQEEKAGAEAALEANRKGFNELIKSGAIPPGASPHFRQAYAMQTGRIAADAYAAARDTAYEASDIRKEDDPAKVQKWIAEFRKGWVDQNMPGADPATIGNAFNLRAGQFDSAFAQRHTARRVDEIQAEQAQKTEQEAFGIIDRTFTQGPQATAKALTTLKDSLIAAGAKGADMTKALIVAVVTKAKERNDPRILRVLDHIETGTGKLGDTALARTQREAAEKAISHESDRRYRLGLIQAQEARRVATVDVQNRAIQKMLDGGNVFDEARELAKYNPAGAESLLTWHRSFTTFNERPDKVVDNPEKHSELLTDIHTKNAPFHETQAKILESLAKKEIKPATARQLLDDAAKMESGKRFLDAEEFKQLDASVKKFFIGSDLTLEGGDTKTSAAFLASIKARQMWLEFMEKNPKAGITDQFKARSAIYSAIVTDPAFVREAEAMKAQAEKNAEPPKPAPKTPETKPAPKSAAPAQPAPDKNAIEWLKRNGSNPKAKEIFEKRFGPGSADQHLKK